MKTYLLIIQIVLTASLAGVGTLKAQTAAEGSVMVNNLQMLRNDDHIWVKMDLDLSSLQVSKDLVVLLTPCIAAGDNMRELPAVGIYGRGRYYHYLRNNGADMLSGPKETVVRASAKPDVQPYEAVIPYEEWMEGAGLTLLRQDYGCCNSILAEAQTPLMTDFRSPVKDAVSYFPRFVYVRPKAEAVKSRSLSGSAFINFPVNRMDIHPDYYDNRAELRKITATIDSVKADADIRITALSIKGYASPEGSYVNNERLAQGRTKTLKDYVSNLYSFPDDFIQTSYEPENWEGLRSYVASSGLEHREDILAIIDDDRYAPDAREWKIKSAYPADYRFLLQNCYPRLRRSDYKVEYVIRKYSDVEEIKRIMQKQPQKLSLEEFYLAAQSMEAGSSEFDEAFETAVRMYPDDETANLNAANSAMKRGDLKNAERYLQKAGQSPQATYARGALALLQKNTEQAAACFEEAAKAGIAEAEAELNKIRMK